MREITCCFTGHRKIPYDKIGDIKSNLSREIDALIERGVTRFISGGALGFDQMVASVLLQKRDAGMAVNIILALPCEEQDKFWRYDDRMRYAILLGKADEIIYVSEKYSHSCMSKRNKYMVENSGYCICALLEQRSGTGQTVRFARDSGLEVINIAQ